MGFVLAHYAGIKTKGFKEYSKEYFQPIFFMMPLNVIGELAKVISISFRLFWQHHGGVHYHSGGISPDLQHSFAAPS